MKILFTADLHLNVVARSPATGLSALEAFAEAVADEDPDAVVIAGDIGSPKRAPEHLEQIQNKLKKRLVR